MKNDQSDWPKKCYQNVMSVSFYLKNTDQKLGIKKPTNRKEKNHWYNMFIEIMIKKPK